ncbi:hypothetical protein ACH4NT_19975 [Streptomyces lydicus]|uniref:hypothetical protein n=1 Tax=Streptomyces lydicus TaxID=47763 RepID=UPI0037B38601
MYAMQPVPTPCPPDLVPDVSEEGTYYAAYRQAKRQRAVFIAIECQAQLWTVKADTLTAGPDHTVDDRVTEKIRAAVAHLVQEREIRPNSHVSPGYCALFDIHTEPRVRELAAALHAALYEDLVPLSRAVPAVF